jgi:carbon monoxide dehydrogenase subunit G
MGTVQMQIERPIGDVWNVVTDANGYPEWLVGAQDVDAPTEWPTPGAVFHHRIGFGPLTVLGSTTARVTEKPTRFAISAGMGPLGQADATFELTAVDETSTRVTITEHPAKGLVRAVHRVAGSLVERSIDARNTKSLEKLRERMLVAP